MKTAFLPFPEQTELLISELKSIALTAISLNNNPLTNNLPSIFIYTLFILSSK